jgi:uncharacterized HAD superfamily protein
MNKKGMRPKFLWYGIHLEISSEKQLPQNRIKVENCNILSSHRKVRCQDATQQYGICDDDKSRNIGNIFLNLTKWLPLLPHTYQQKGIREPADHSH